MEERAQALAVIRRRVERWRRQEGGRGSRIPAVLWDEAAGVARRHGVHATARTLRLNYYRLKARVAVADAAASTGRFVELRAEPAPVTATATVVELMNAHGDQMRMHLSGARTTDLVGLAEAFWSLRS